MVTVMCILLKKKKMEEKKYKLPILILNRAIMLSVFRQPERDVPDLPQSWKLFLS